MRGTIDGAIRHALIPTQNVFKFNSIDNYESFLGLHHLSRVLDIMRTKSQNGGVELEESNAMMGNNGGVELEESNAMMGNNGKL